MSTVISKAGTTIAFDALGKGAVVLLVDVAMYQSQLPMRLFTPRIDIPALMFHAAADNITPVEDSRAVAQVWRNANVVETQGLGHRGALQSREIHD